MHPRPPVINMVHGYLFDDETPAWKRTILESAERLTAGQTDLLLAMNQWDYHTAQRLHLGRRIAWVPGIGVDFSKLDAPPGGCSPEYIRSRCGRFCSALCRRIFLTQKSVHADPRSAVSSGSR